MQSLEMIFLCFMSVSVFVADVFFIFYLRVSLQERRIVAVIR